MKLSIAILHTGEALDPTTSTWIFMDNPYSSLSRFRMFPGTSTFHAELLFAPALEPHPSLLPGMQMAARSQLNRYADVLLFEIFSLPLVLVEVI